MPQEEAPSSVGGRDRLQICQERMTSCQGICFFPRLDRDGDGLGLAHDGHGVPEKERGSLQTGLRYIDWCNSACLLSGNRTQLHADSFVHHTLPPLPRWPGKSSCVRHRSTRIEREAHVQFVVILTHFLATKIMHAVCEFAINQRAQLHTTYVRTSTHLLHKANGRGGTHAHAHVQPPASQREGESIKMNANARARPSSTAATTSPSLAAT